MDKHIKMHTRKTDFTHVNDRSLKQTEPLPLKCKEMCYFRSHGGFSLVFIFILLLVQSYEIQEDICSVM